MPGKAVNKQVCRAFEDKMVKGGALFQTCQNTFDVTDRFSQTRNRVFAILFVFKSDQSLIIDFQQGCQN